MSELGVASEPPAGPLPRCVCWRRQVHTTLTTHPAASGCPADLPAPRHENPLNACLKRLVFSGSCGANSSQYSVMHKVGSLAWTEGATRMGMPPAWHAAHPEAPHWPGCNSGGRMGWRAEECWPVERWACVPGCLSTHGCMPVQMAAASVAEAESTALCCPGHACMPCWQGAGARHAQSAPAANATASSQ